MKTAGQILLLIMGILAFIGVLMPWMGESGWGWSGWLALRFGGIGGETINTQILLMSIGSLLLLISALPALVISANTEGSKTALLSLYILASIGAAVCIGGGSWFLFDAIREEAVAYLIEGFYISYIAAILGLVFGIIGSIRTATQE